MSGRAFLHLITGGSGSGKSEWAEEQILRLPGGPRIYLATMRPGGAEGEARVARHRRMRAGKGFLTVECFRDLASAPVPERANVLLECMSNLAANEMFEEGGAGADAERVILEGVARLLARARHLVIVTNEVFSDGIVYPKETRDYQRLLGSVNCHLAAMADRVTEVVYGIPLEMKG